MFPRLCYLPPGCPDCRGEAPPSSHCGPHPRQWSTHAPKRFPRWLVEQALSLDRKVAFQVYWLPTNASWLDQIEIWFSLLQRKLLHPNHFASRDDLEQTIQDFITHYHQTAKPLRCSYTVEQLERKLATRLTRDAKPAGAYT